MVNSASGTTDKASVSGNAEHGGGQTVSHNKHYEKASKLEADIFSEPGSQSAENFGKVKDLYTQAYEARLKELNLPASGELTADQKEIAQNDPMLNLYEQKIELTEKCVNLAGTGLLDNAQAFEVFREGLAVDNMFWMTYSQDPSLTPEQRQQAQLKAEESAEKLAFLQEQWSMIKRIAFG